MAEWSKAHAWKVCIRQKCIEGSNPFLSAKYVICVIYFYIFNTQKIKKQNNEEISMFNWNVFNVIHPFQLQAFPQEEIDSLAQEVDSTAQSEVLESSNDIVEWKQCSSRGGRT